MEDTYTWEMLEIHGLFWLDKKEKILNVSQLFIIRFSECTCEQLTRDHKPDDPLEMQVILKAGGRIDSYRDHAGNKVGPERVWLKHEDIPGLAMSRSFGD